MFKNKEEKRRQFLYNKVNDLNKNFNNSIIYESLEMNIKNIKKLFKDDNTLIIREFESHDTNLHFTLLYCQGLVNSELINENIISPLMNISNTMNNNENIISTIIKSVVLIDSIKRTNKLKDIIEDVTYGDTILFVDGFKEALILNTKQFIQRSVTEPEGEKIILGPREGFTETLITNLSLVRRKLRTNKLKFKYLKVGRDTNSRVCICYIDGIAEYEKINELCKKLSKIKIDGLIDTNYINELITDKKASPFHSMGYTERPDVVVGKILEGRIAIFLDGTPVVLTVPYLFIENFQNSEDYYTDYYYSSFSRILRILGFVFAISVPAIYIAISGFHQEMFPTPLFINIAFDRQTVPLPASLEVFIMLLVFDILKETGMRMPNNIAQALSIVGAIVIGQAAVEAKLVASTMVIVVSFTGITSLLIPRLSTPIVVIRLVLLILSSTLGLFGFIIGISILIIHIFNLTSLGVPQVSLSGDLKFQKLKDTFIRAPWWKMQTRPTSITNNIWRRNVR